MNYNQYSNPYPDQNLTNLTNLTNPTNLTNSTNPINQDAIFF